MSKKNQNETPNQISTGEADPNLMAEAAAKALQQERSTVDGQDVDVDQLSPEAAYDRMIVGCTAIARALELTVTAQREDIDPQTGEVEVESYQRNLLQFETQSLFDTMHWKLGKLAESMRDTSNKFSIPRQEERIRDLMFKLQRNEDVADQLNAAIGYLERANERLAWIINAQRAVDEFAGTTQRAKDRAERRTIETTIDVSAAPSDPKQAALHAARLALGRTKATAAA